ncbi:DUF6233 domain-containing protein [Streptomyces sp. NBC_01410]|uniref:DUF6233 domain-containing protein n=1 Tax=Streptomyces sp. NBC_01410 TaxID=2903856 RepID=UPI00386B1BDB
MERERQAYDATGPRRTHVHTEDCPIYKGPFDLTAQQALQAATQPAAAVCTMCSAAKKITQLRQHPTPGTPSAPQTPGRHPATGRRAPGHPHLADGSGPRNGLLPDVRTAAWRGGVVLGRSRGVVAAGEPSMDDACKSGRGGHPLLRRESMLSGGGIRFVNFLRFFGLVRRGH